jgi:hypothetical protein
MPHLIIAGVLALVNLIGPLLVNKTIKDTDMANAAAALTLGGAGAAHHRHKAKKAKADAAKAES